MHMQTIVKIFNISEEKPDENFYVDPLNEHGQCCKYDI